MEELCLAALWLAMTLQLVSAHIEEHLVVCRDGLSQVDHPDQGVIAHLQQSSTLHLTPSTLMASTAVPAIILNLVLTFAFNRRSVPCSARPLLNFLFCLDPLFLLLLGHFGSKFLLSCHQLLWLAVTAIPHLKTKPCITSLNFLLNFLSIQPSHSPCMGIKLG